MSRLSRSVSTALLILGLMLPAALFAKGHEGPRPTQNLSRAADSLFSLVRHITAIFGGSGSRLDPNGAPIVSPPMTSTTSTDQGDSGSRLDPNG